MNLNKKKQQYVYNFFAYAVLSIIGFLFVFPILCFFSNSLKTYEQIFAYPPTLFSLPLKLGNYLEAIKYQSLPFFRFLLNSCFVTVFSVIGGIISSSIVAFSFSRLKWKGRDILFTIVVLTMIIPKEIVITPQFIIYSKLALLDTYIPLILPCFFGIPFYIFILRQTMMGVPIEMDEAAKIDGCNTMQTFLFIILPQVKLALIAVAILAIQEQWNNYLEPLIFITTQEKQLVSVGLSYFSGMYQTQWNLVFAASAIVALPILILFAFLQKYFIQGVVVSGVKG